MGAEHAAVLSVLERLRCLTNDYVPPAGVCTRYQIACQSLESLASDLLQHIHLENAVLFPQARELEAGL